MGAEQEHFAKYRCMFCERCIMTTTFEILKVVVYNLMYGNIRICLPDNRKLKPSNVLIESPHIANNNFVVATLYAGRIQ